MQQTTSQAAQLYGKARSTIHRAIDAGRLSCTVRGDGVRVVDLSELIRLWGEPDRMPPEAQQDATAGEAATQQAMLDELRAMRELYLAGLEREQSLTAGSTRTQGSDAATTGTASGSAARRQESS